MAIIIFYGSFGRNYEFAIREKDGITPRNLTGLTVIWRLKSITNPNTLYSINCVATDVTNGLCYGTMIVGVSDVLDTYECQIELSQSGVLLDTCEYFTAIVSKSAAQAG